PMRRERYPSGMGWGRWRLAALALAALGLLALLTSCTSPGAPLDGLTEAQRQARPLAVAWAWDLRLTRALWQQALATSEVASRAQPDVPEGAQQAARALRYRDAVRQ